MYLTIFYKLDTILKTLYNIFVNKNVNDKINITDILQLIFFLALLAIPTYFAYKVLLPKELKVIENISTEEEEEVDETETVVEEIAEQDEVATSGKSYEEMFIEIGGQMAYIAVPTTIEVPATIVVYSHGSNTRVTTDTEDSFIQDLQSYGEVFTTQNLIFAASNEHGENWGNTDSINDIVNLIAFIEDEYTVSDNIYMLGFSMGALPTMHYTQQHPKRVEKIALLAPTTRTYEWNSTNIEDVMDIDIKIWHGIADYNIAIGYSENFVNYMDNLGKDIEFLKLGGKTHFDVDAEYMDEVLEFFVN